jgi:hypothetical protein
MYRRGRLAVAAAVLAAGVASAMGCSVASSEPPSATIPSPAESEAQRSPTVAARPSAPGAAESAVAAARAFLAESSARFELRIDRFKPDLPDEVTALGSGVVDPAGDRGSMTYELLPDEPADSPLALPPFDIVWDATDWWAADPVKGDKPQRWTHATRARVHETALIGRVQEEPLGLLRFVAAADPASFEALPADKLDGKIAERWLVPVPVGAARAIYVPPDTYLAFDTIFDVDALPLEIWLINGRVARVGYVFEREKAPYGGPDRIETWFDWTDVGEPIELEIPPAGEIVELAS